MNKIITRIFIIIFLMTAFFSCQAEITDPVIQESNAPQGDTDLEEWDPSKVMIPGINLITFTDGDRETTWPYYKANATHKIKYKIVSGTSTVDGAVDPGLYTVTLQFSANSGVTWTNITGAVSLPSVAGVESTFDWAVAPPQHTDGNNYLVKAIAANAAGKVLSTQSSRLFTIDGTAPVINSFGLTPGALGVVNVGSVIDNSIGKVVNRSFFETSLTASDTTTVIKYVCVKAFDTDLPTTDDPCWQDLQEEATKNLIKTDISTFVGFVQNTYKISVWVMDYAGNISGLTAGAGLENTDQITIAYNPAVAPNITNVIASTNDSSSLAPSNSETNFTFGQTLYVRWKVTDSDLTTTPISLYYTTDEVTYTPISGMQNISNSPVGCTSGGDTSNFTGCRKITAPSSGYFKIQVKVADQSGLISLSSTPALNTGKFSVVAGNTDLGLNGSANKALFLSDTLAPDQPGAFGSLVVSSKGKIYFLDKTRGVLLVDPVDGTQRVYLPKSTIASGDGGVVSQASILGNGKINIDYQDRLLIYENGRIRRVENDGTINTIIGGGTINTYTKAVPAKDLQIGVYADRYSMFQVLPNGNIWFTMSYSKANFPDYLIGIYKASEDKVYFLKLSGKGVKDDPEYTFSNKDIIFTVGLSFNYRNSQPESLAAVICKSGVSNCAFKSVTFNARNGVSVGYGSHVPGFSFWGSQNFASRRGNLFQLGTHFPYRLGKYDLAINKWRSILGGEKQGHCVDGSAAVYCYISGSDAFVDATNTVYFVDAGQIRVILPDGKVKTLFGESKSSGDGFSPLSARLNEVQYMGVWGASNTIIAADAGEHNVREITQGSDSKIYKLAGNSFDESIAFEGPSDSRYSVNVASAAAFVNSFWGGSQGIQVDPRDGTFYALFTRSGVVVKYEKDVSTGKAGKWKIILGGGSTSFYSQTANGLEGQFIASDGFPLTLHGIMIPDGSTTGQYAVENGTAQAYLIASGFKYSYTSNCYADTFSKIFTSTSGTVRKFMGKNIDPACYPGIQNYEYGKDITESINMPVTGNSITSSIYLKEERAMLMVAPGAYYVVKAAISRDGSDMITGAGMSTRWTTTAKPILSFNYKKNNSNQYELFYCSTDGSLNKKNISTNVETKLDLPKDSSNNNVVKCDGRSISWDKNKEHIYFPFRQNGLSGIGKLCINASGVCL